MKLEIMGKVMRLLRYYPVSPAKRDCHPFNEGELRPHPDPLQDWRGIVRFIVALWLKGNYKILKSILIVWITHPRPS